MLNDFKFPFEPYPFQEEAVNKVLDLNSCILKAGVGAGKTAMASWAALLKAQTSNVKHLLFLVPASLIIQWGRWWRKITWADGSPLDVLVYDGTPTWRNKTNLNHDVIIMSHQIFLRDYDKIYKQLHKDTFVVYDECHQGLRKIGYKRSGSIKGNKIWYLLKNFVKNKDLLMMSATPVGQPADVYAVVKLVAPDLYRSKKQFERIHVADKDWFGNITGWKELQLIKENLDCCMVEIAEEDMPDIPNVTYQAVPYKLGKRHLLKYRQLVEQEIMLDDDGGVIDITDAEKKFHTLQKFVVNPHDLNLKSIHSKLLDLVTTIYEEDSSPLIICGNYRRTNELLLEKFKDKAVGVWGAFTKRQRQESLDKFIHGDVPILVMNPRSAGVGTDGLQHVCYRMLLVELPLTPIEFEQLIGRISRNGQEHKCNVKMLVAEETIQEQLFRSLISKDDLLAKIVSKNITLREAICG